MAEHIGGPLSYERAGHAGSPLLFIHPNPMDHSAWTYQLAHFSTWFRCVAVDLPGYGTSPAADDGLAMADLAQACWETLDELARGERAVLVGSSIGGAVALHMRRARPAQTAALVLAPHSYGPKDYVPRRIRAFADRGVAYRWDFTLEDFSPAFRSTEMATYFARLFTERNGSADVGTVIRSFQALGAPEPPDLHEVECPTLIVVGSEDHSFAGAHRLRDRIAGSELKVIDGAGHACYIEQPSAFDALLLDFLRAHGFVPEG